MMSPLPDLSPLAPLVAAVRQGRLLEVLDPALRALFPGVAYALFLFRPGCPPSCLLDNLAETRRTQVLDPYLGGMYLLDPLYHHASRGPREGLASLSEIMPEGFRQSDYYRHYYKGIALHDEFMLCCNLPDAVLVLSMGCYEGPGPRRLRAQLASLQPLLTAFLVEGLGPLNLAREQGAAPELLGDLEGSEALSPREQQVAQLILRGFAGKAIARQLGISPETVKIHRRHLYRKLGVASQAELFSRFLHSRGIERANQ